MRPGSACGLGTFIPGSSWSHFYNVFMISEAPQHWHPKHSHESVQDCSRQRVNLTRRGPERSRAPRCHGSWVRVGRRPFMGLQVARAEAAGGH